MAVRVQPGELRAAATGQSGPVCVRAGACRRECAAAAGGRAGRPRAPCRAGAARQPFVKLAFVVQRYGDQIAGGSEAHCRELARRLAPTHDVTVLTTCATDYVTWANS